MKVLALNSSARVGVESKTEMMLEALVAGMVEAGAEVETINLKDKKIKPCQGCFSCWTKTPGKCIHQDDMSREILPKMQESDVVIYASPLFIHTFNATMQLVLERSLPGAEPYLIQMEDGTWSHPVRGKSPQAVVLSVAGFPEMQAFDALMVLVDHHFRKVRDRLWGELYRPGAESLTMMRPLRDEVLAATRQAGRELVETKSISPETKARVEQPVTGDMEEITDMARCYWDSCIKNKVTPRQFNERKLTPEPDSVKTFLAMMKYGFNPKKAGDGQAVMQFEFSGPVQGTCHMAIANGAIKTAVGPAESPDVIIRTPFDLWVDIMTDRQDPGQAFMDGKYTVEGDMEVLMNMNKFFGGEDEE